MVATFRVDLPGKPGQPGAAAVGIPTADGARLVRPEKPEARLRPGDKKDGRFRRPPRSVPKSHGFLSDQVGKNC